VEQYDGERHRNLHERPGQHRAHALADRGPIVEEDTQKRRGAHVQNHRNDGDQRGGGEGVRAMLPGAFVQVPMALSIVLLHSLRGAGSTREAFAIAVLGSLVVRISATLFFVHGLHLGLAGVWLGSGSDWILRAGLSAWRWHLGRWSRVKV
jgi:hypothetical protein